MGTGFRSLWVSLRWPSGLGQKPSQAEAGTGLVINVPQVPCGHEDPNSTEHGTRRELRGPFPRAVIT